ncbi:hypothetical protein LCGC14_1045460 [marine sediment metagenome]|uniref:Uncharacterized protein n=1 Tax=marine sediment metagenome TaxID=412755 RepID=A0A0F9Q8K4_9ZZZZ
MKCGIIRGWIYYRNHWRALLFISITKCFINLRIMKYDFFIVWYKRKLIV